jgi:hypothetical protein
MPMKILEFEKLILEKVSFDQLLFEKELRKASIRLPLTEWQELQGWCLNKFPGLISRMAIATDEAEDGFPFQSREENPLKFQ